MICRRCTARVDRAIRLFQANLVTKCLSCWQRRLWGVITKFGTVIYTAVSTYSLKNQSHSRPCYPTRFCHSLNYLPSLDQKSPLLCMHVLILLVILSKQSTPLLDRSVLEVFREFLERWQYTKIGLARLGDHLPLRLVGRSIRDSADHDKFVPPVAALVTPARLNGRHIAGVTADKECETVVKWVVGRVNGGHVLWKVGVSQSLQVRERNITYPGQSPSARAADAGLLGGSSLVRRCICP
jgi:hypothetical protein